MRECARILRGMTSRRARSLPETRGRRPAGSTRPIRRPLWEIPTERAGCELSPNAGSGIAAPGPPAPVRNRTSGSLMQRGHFGGATQRLPLAVRPVGSGAADGVFASRDQSQYRTCLDSIVFQTADLGQTPGNRRRNVKRGGAGQYFHQPFTLPNSSPARDKPMADNDRYVGTGPQVGQDHCRQTHGENPFRLLSFGTFHGSKRALSRRHDHVSITSTLAYLATADLARSMSQQDRFFLRLRNSRPSAFIRVARIVSGHRGSTLMAQILK